MGQLHSHILSTIGNTPVVRINRLAPEHINLYVKLESFNPMASIKDRLALGVIEAAERDGSLSPGQTIVEATSGNTGIGLAMVCAQKGYPLVITMAENFSLERRRLMRYLGAKVILTPASEKGTGMVAKAKELADKHGWFFTRQFENEANADIHSQTTAREILNDFSEIGLDYWVSGFGTGGTLKGVAQVLKRESPHTIIVGAEPDNSQLLSSGIVQEYLGDGSPASSHPNFRPHMMQGWTPDFIPKLANDALKQGLLDQIIPVNGAKSLEIARSLATEEGIFVGISSGATFSAALKIAEKAPRGANLLCMLPDTGERYLSTVLFDHISDEMNTDEIAISKSTPRYRFDASPARTPIENTNPTEIQLCPKAEKFVAEAISDPDNPVVMFALEWCEFCWSMRKFFQEANIPFQAIDLDSLAFQKGGFGGNIRAVLKSKTGSPTIPQIFIGGQLIGGCTDTFDAHNDGSLENILSDNEVIFNASKQIDAYKFLPGWIHPR